jgi:hypothetical protein
LSDTKNEKKKDGRSIASVMMDVPCGRLPNSETFVSCDGMLMWVLAFAPQTVTVTFFRLKPPLEATDIVRTLCESAQKPEGGTIRSKFIHRLTPVTRTGKATLEGVKEVAMTVLAPHFHSGQEGIKVCFV